MTSHVWMKETQTCDVTTCFYFDTFLWIEKRTDWLTTWISTHMYSVPLKKLSILCSFKDPYRLYWWWWSWRENECLAHKADLSMLTWANALTHFQWLRCCTAQPFQSIYLHCDSWGPQTNKTAAVSIFSMQRLRKIQNLIPSCLLSVEMISHFL